MFRDATAQSILIAKSCISNPCDRCLCDDPCLSKFGALRGCVRNPLIVCGLSDTLRGLSKRGRDTESDANIQLEKMLTFFSNEYSICISIRNRKA